MQNEQWLHHVNDRKSLWVMITKVIMIFGITLIIINHHIQLYKSRNIFHYNSIDRINHYGYSHICTFSSRASLESLSAPKARDSIVMLRALFNLDLVVRARTYILRTHSRLFLVIWYWSSIQFYNIVNVNYIFSKLLEFLIPNGKGN